MTQEILLCARCGNINDVDARLAVCGATVQFQNNNFPAPNTTETRYNNIKVWRLMLCKKCLPDSYGVFLRRHIRMIAGQLALYAFLGLIALIWWFFMRGDRMNVAAMQGILVIAVMGAAIAGIIGVPVCTVMLLLDYQRLHVLQQSGTVPIKRLDKSFVGEGQRVIEALKPHKPNTGEKVFGTFPLPLQKKRDGQEMTLDEESQQRHGFGTRDIVAVGKTLDELEIALPATWKSLWVSLESGVKNDRNT